MIVLYTVRVRQKYKNKVQSPHIYNSPEAPNIFKMFLNPAIQDHPYSTSNHQIATAIWLAYLLKLKCSDMNCHIIICYALFGY